MHVFTCHKQYEMSESSRLAAVSHGKVRLGLVEHLLELCIRLQLSLVVIGVVAHLMRRQMHKQTKTTAIKNFTQSEAMGD